jgi:hypothetical protein
MASHGVNMGFKFWMETCITTKDFGFYLARLMPGSINCLFHEMKKSFTRLKEAFRRWFQRCRVYLQKQEHLAIITQAEASSFSLDLPYNVFYDEVIPLANYFLPSLEQWLNTLPWMVGGWWKSGSTHRQTTNRC